MAKKYKQLESGLSVPTSYDEGLVRRRPTTRRNFIFTPGGGPCRCVFCSICSDEDEFEYPSAAAANYLIKLTGIRNQTCDACTSLNAEYVVEWDRVYDYWGIFNYCVWRHEMESPICDFTHVLLTVRDGGAAYPAIVYITNNAVLSNASKYYGWLWGGPDENGVGCSSWDEAPFVGPDSQIMGGCYFPDDTDPPGTMAYVTAL